VLARQLVICIIKPFAPVLSRFVGSITGSFDSAPQGEPVMLDTLLGTIKNTRYTFNTSEKHCCGASDVQMRPGSIMVTFSLTLLGFNHYLFNFMT
jgi:hypothetical protein